MKPETIDTYLETVPDTHRAALIQLRDRLGTLCPDTTVA
jgi:hypothetical protein